MMISADQLDYQVDGFFYKAHWGCVSHLTEFEIMQLGYCEEY